MKRAVALLLLTMSCGPQGSPEQRYRRAVLTLRRGELTQALDASRLEAGRSTPDSQYYWKFRLLEAEVLIYQGNPTAAAAILSRSIPDRQEFADIDARRKLLRAYLPKGQPKQETGKLIDDALRQASRLGDIDLLLDVEISKGYYLSPDD